MIRITEPLVKVYEVYTVCVSGIKNDEMRERMLDCLFIIKDDEKLYINKGKNHELYTLKTKDEINGVSKKEFEKLYNYRMLNKDQDGREYYIKFLNSIETCPYCGVRDVWTIDHYLPKTKFPSYTVAPINLVPSCYECNIHKDTYRANTKSDELWHPYFDFFTEDQWLSAKVVEKEPLAFVFSLTVPDSINKNDEAVRKCKHFSVLHLGKLYSTLSANHFNSIKGYLKQLYYNAGVNAVKQHIESMSNSSKSDNLNSWETAMYDAILNCSWFFETWLTSQQL